jgi:glycosyltransferase involved in cell wall biosynthesis
MLNSKRRLLCLVPTTLDALEAKGVAKAILERDENGYFDHVYTIHLQTPKNQTVELNDVHTVIEYGGGFENIRRYSFRILAFLLNEIAAINSIQKLIKTEHISIIRAQDPYFSGLHGLLLEKLTGVPCCISIHADYDKRYEIDKKYGATLIFGSRKLAKMLERFVLSHAKIVMPIRESLGKGAIKNGAKPETIRVIPHGIDTTKFLRNPDPDLKKEFGVEGKKLVIFAGRLSKENYVEDIVKSAAKVVKRFPDAVFLLLGDGHERESLSKLIEDLNLKDNVKLPGFQSQDKVVDFRVNADVNLCLMGGFSLIEAAVSGKPAIAYDVEWHYELIKNRETGFLIKEGDIDAVADAVVELLNHPELGKRLGENARKLAMERHSIEASSKIKIKHYEELLQISKR